MSMTELNVSFPSEKLQALRFFISKKDQTIEQELQDYLNKTYEKMVPAQVREYVESSMEQEPTQQQEPEQPAAARERSARQTRRQREQITPEPASAPEAPSESEGPAEQENQGMTMSM